MLINLKAMIYVLAVAMAVFIAAKPVCLRFMAEEDFKRRRNVWMVLTFAAFILPSFWLFVALAVPVIYWSGRRDSSPAALYGLLFYLIPPTVHLPIPVVGINQLFDLDNTRILSFALMIPAALRIAASRDGRGSPGLALVDVLVLAFAGIQLLLFTPYESFTNTMRRASLLSIDSLVVYYVASRTCTRPRALADTMATMCLIGVIYAALAVIETAKGWQLYAGIGDRWGSPVTVAFGYLQRDGILRAKVSTGHPIGLGYSLAIAFGFWVYLSSRLKRTPRTLAVPVALWAGLIATYSRGPWITAALIPFIYAGTGERGFSRVMQLLLVSSTIGALILISPIGDAVIKSLPFVGSVGGEAVAYRQALFDTSWKLIQEHPFLGNPFVLDQMENLRQGQGIIDLVNTYISVVLFYGLIGLGLFLGSYLAPLMAAYRQSRSLALRDPDVARMGSCVIGCIVATFFYWGTSGIGRGELASLLLGMLAGYACMEKQPASAASVRQPVHAG
jgi:hypothetical protein